MLRAAPRNFFGGYRAVESTPPEDAPAGGLGQVVARAKRVSESSSTTTSLPISTKRFARSMTSSATVMWFSVGMSKVEETTSPLMERCMSVTSSGRSSTKRQMR